jgi:hypothetical protein
VLRFRSLPTSGGLFPTDPERLEIPGYLMEKRLKKTITLWKLVFSFRDGL